jgi:hypothetical protein
MPYGGSEARRNCIALFDLKTPEAQKPPLLAELLSELQRGMKPDVQSASPHDRKIFKTRRHTLGKEVIVTPLMMSGFVPAQEILSSFWPDSKVIEVIIAAYSTDQGKWHMNKFADGKNMSGMIYMPKSHIDIALRHPAEDLLVVDNVSKTLITAKIVLCAYRFQLGHSGNIYYTTAEWGREKIEADGTAVVTYPLLEYSDLLRSEDPKKYFKKIIDEHGKEFNAEKGIDSQELTSPR